MQLSNLATASIAQIKQFVRAHNLVPTGDLRRRETWEEAAKAILSATVEQVKEAAIASIREVATYDNAVIAANAVYTGLRKTLKAVWSIVLVAIALACIAIDLWQNQEEVRSALMTIYRRQVSRMHDKWCMWREMGEAAVQLHVTERIDARIVQPVLNHRDRIRAMARAATR
ncbi:hypothetical protein [Myxacorys almedinensis]|uniref:Uncharacterized protein n=1 Tax=Myxacorys almedinensis A TaxID=2690445 RepID=A0A8J8CKF3_9CYAN|nr:hypothetical protein [Myxacorys almedinensis]NDJ19474.1 hypothetical protein [Myxacorys almedinensis A]